MINPLDYLTAEQLMQRWNAGPFQIHMAIGAGLPYYRKNKHGIFNAKDMMALDFNPDSAKDKMAAEDTKPIPDYFFKRSDVEAYEAEIPELRGGQPLDDKGQTKLMRLTRQEPHLIAVADAAPYMAYFVASRFEEGKKTTKAEFVAEGRKEFPKLSPNYFERTLWPTVPKRYKIMDGKA